MGVNANGKIDTVKGTPQLSNPGAACNLHINFPEVGSTGYCIGNNPNNEICAALKIVVPSSSCENWPLVVANEFGETIWAIDCEGNKNINNQITTTEHIEIKMPYPTTEGGSNGLTIGDVTKTTGCYGGISIVLPEGSEQSGIYAIAIVNADGELLWGVDGSGCEVL